DPDMVADALQHRDLVLGRDLEPLHEERGLDPRPIEPADVHPQCQSVDSDAHFPGFDIHQIPPTLRLAYPWLRCGTKDRGAAGLESDGDRRQCPRGRAVPALSES